MESKCTFECCNKWLLIKDIFYFKTKPFIVQKLLENVEFLSKYKRRTNVLEISSFFPSKDF